MPFRRRAEISSHAPARGATAVRHRLLGRLWYFKSRPCTRGDHDQGAVCGGSCISSHAPARGATRAGAISQIKNKISSHAPARGATCWLAYMVQSSIFQVTPLHEGRPKFCLNRCAVYPYFKSRPCTRGDSDNFRRQPREKISSHAPARGATKASRFWVCKARYFKSRPCTRGDKGRCCGL